MAPLSLDPPSDRYLTFEEREIIALEFENAARRPKETKLKRNEPLRRYVQARLAGEVAHPDGSRVPGPEFRRTRRKTGSRMDRRWASAWSPEQISNRLPVDFPDDEAMRISPECRP